MGSGFSPEPPRNQDNSWLGKVYIVAAILAVLLSLLLFGGCSKNNFPYAPGSTTEHTSVEKKDSTYYRDTTIYVPIPLENGQVVTRANEKARAETSIAEAEAFVDTLGLLHLDLRNKPTHIEAVVKIPHREIWVNVSSKREEIKPLVIQVEKPLSWWRKFQIRSFWYLCGAFLLLLAWCTRKWWLKLLKIL